MSYYNDDDDVQVKEITLGSIRVFCVCGRDEIHCIHASREHAWNL